MGNEITKELYERLSKPLSKEAIQRSDKSETKKGYDTTGYGYQYLVNRFNKVMGIGNWNWRFKIVQETQGKYKSGMPFVDISANATITVKVDGEWTKHTEPGGHRSSNYTDARKGASTNAFKKCAAFYGVGKDAFEGSIDKKGKKYADEDNRDQGGKDEDIKKITRETTKGKRLMPVIEVNKKIDSIDSKEKAEKMKKWIERNQENYTEVQVNVIKRRLEEVIKNLK